MLRTGRLDAEKLKQKERNELRWRPYLVLTRIPWARHFPASLDREVLCWGFWTQGMGPGRNVKDDQKRLYGVIMGLWFARRSTLSTVIQKLPSSHRSVYIVRARPWLSLGGCTCSPSFHKPLSDRATLWVASGKAQENVEDSIHSQMNPVVISSSHLGKCRFCFKEKGDNSQQAQRINNNRSFNWWSESEKAGRSNCWSLIAKL